MPLASSNPGAATLGWQKKLVLAVFLIDIPYSDFLSNHVELFTISTYKSYRSLINRFLQFLLYDLTSFKCTGIAACPLFSKLELPYIKHIKLNHAPASLSLSQIYKLAAFAARQKKAMKIFPRPTVGPLRPTVHGQTLKYNMKVRAGKGFSIEELEDTSFVGEASTLIGVGNGCLLYALRLYVQRSGIPKKVAATIGMAVDHHRRNLSLEGLQANVERLKSYKAKLVVFPRRAGRVQAGESSAEELETATEIPGQDRPIVREKPTGEFVKITDEMKSFKACDKLRIERMNQRYICAGMKRAAEAEKEEKK
ncbi:hypothetical protein RJ640_024557 [Escallonia rubra]|uniref:60S ribosomal protein L13 n=1 Tax=Escallonia rubra TaxID=112253 RepID=A0AA88UVP0_9ASTE|nr:hypothetical protein RJ640_024557 [Escallonia rubra]